ncbi:MAG: DUF3179 domain-containing protein [Bacteroidota bacterium]
MQLKYLSTLLILLIFYACEQQQTVDNESWLIPKSEVRDGGPGKDGIPSIDNPIFIDAETADFLDPDDLIVGVKVGDDIRAYPHLILDWHEIVNDQLDDLALSLNYCPLTGTAIGWNRTIDGNTTTFGVSGLLYNTNLMPYDRLTNSTWSQMRLDCVGGELKGESADLYPVVETTWANWKKRYRNTKVLSTNTGFNRRYGQYPYGDYRTSNQLIFPVNNRDDRLNPKERVLGIIVENEVKVYRFESVSKEINNVIQDQIRNVDIVIFGSQQDNYLIAYEARTEDGTTLSFDAINGTEEAVAIDNEGNEWNLFGEAISGARKGQKLLSTKSYIGYFFSWGAFYPSLEIYEE